MREWNKLFIGKDGLLRHKSGEFTQLILPRSFQKLIFQELHQDMGHLGPERVHHLARERFFWPNMYHDIKHFVTKVCPCLKQRRPSFITREPLQSLTSSSPFDLVSIDFLHLEQSSGGYEYVLVIMDHFAAFPKPMLLRINLPTLLLQSSSMSSSIDLGFPHACIMIRAKNLKTPFFVPWNSFMISFIHEPALITQKVMGRLRDSITPSLPCYEPYQKRKSLNGQSISTRLCMHITALFITALDSPPSTFCLVIHHDSQLILYLLTPTQHLFRNIQNMQCSGEMLWKAPIKLLPIMPPSM